MPADLHKGIALDDQYAKVTGAIETQLEKLQKLLAEFEKADHRPTPSQVNSLRYSVVDLGKVHEGFQALREKK